MVAVWTFLIFERSNAYIFAQFAQVGVVGGRVQHECKWERIFCNETSVLSLS